MYPLKIKEKYDQNNLTTLSHRFSVVYLWTYKDGDYTQNIGSHPGVDIVPESKNQEVVSVLDGKIFKCGEDGAYGKFVFIEHENVPDPDDMSKLTTLYSCYEHLSEVKVNIWDIVKEWTLIGKTGNTGNSFWEHLHFQIDRIQAPFHAYWPFTWVEAKAAWQSFTGAVNIWLGIEKARMYTINPLVYLDTVFINKISNEKQIQEVWEIKKDMTIPTLINDEVKPITLTPVSIVPEVPLPKIEEKLEVITSSSDNLIVDNSANILSSL